MLLNDADEPRVSAPRRVHVQKPIPKSSETYLYESIRRIQVSRENGLGHSGEEYEEAESELTALPHNQLSDAEDAFDRLGAICDELAVEYHLSRREREVMQLLARGHNAAYVEQQLCIARSTAKTHINHIYQKLAIHSRQELLTLVETKNQR